VLTFILDIVLVGFQELSYHIPSMICKVMEAYEGEHLSNTLVYEFEHITMKGGICVIKVSFLSLVGFMDQRWSETPPIVTTQWDMKIASFRRWSLLTARYSTIP